MKNVKCYILDENEKLVFDNLRKEEKIRLGDYDYSDYRNGTGRVDRGHVAMVHRPDTDTNPCHDEPRFPSQEEYDDYIKWRD